MRYWSDNRGTMVAALILILAVGVGLRLADLGERDLWTDEAWVAQAVAQTDWRAVFRQGNAEMGNHTPPLYLLTVWAIRQVGGESEAVLRLTSLMFGLGALGLTAWLAWRLLPPGAALTASLAAALSIRLVYFSKELKPYAADAGCAVLALALTERLLANQGRKGWLALFLAMAAGLGYSHALIFTLPVTAAVLWWGLPASRRRCLVTFAGLAGVFLGYYLLFYRGQVRPELVGYWQEYFPDLTGPTALIHWLASAWQRYLRYFIGERWWWVGAGFVLLGVGSLVTGPDSRALGYFLGPLAVSLTAACLHRYPFMAGAGGMRLMVFSAPAFYLVLGAGVAALFAWRPLTRLGWLRPLAAAGLVIWLNPYNVWTENLRPQANREEIQPLVRYLEEHRQPEDLIYVYYFAIHPFRYYYQGPSEPVIWGQSCHEQCLALPPRPPGSPGRLWLIFSHFETREELERFTRRLLGEGWRQDRQIFRTGAALFRFTRPGPETARPWGGKSPPGPS